jgi:hypothetical protein
VSQGLGAASAAQRPRDKLRPRLDSIIRSTPPPRTTLFLGPTVGVSFIPLLGDDAQARHPCRHDPPPARAQNPQGR